MDCISDSATGFEIKRDTRLRLQMQQYIGCAATFVDFLLPCIAKHIIFARTRRDFNIYRKFLPALNGAQFTFRPPQIHSDIVNLKIQRTEIEIRKTIGLTLPNFQQEDRFAVGTIQLENNDSFSRLRNQFPLKLLLFLLHFYTYQRSVPILT